MKPIRESRELDWDGEHMNPQNLGEGDATRQWWQDGNHFFNGDLLEIAKREKEGRRATIYHRKLSGEIETLVGTIIECKPEAIRFRWHDWYAGVTREHDLNGQNIANWIIGAKHESF